jgi:acetyl esterase/lipase
MLIYPVISFVDEGFAHKLSRASLTNNDSSLYAKLSPELHVTKDSPPIFLVHGSGDTGVSPLNSIAMFEACEKAKVPVGLHILEGGPHGFGLGGDDPILKSWPDMAFHWLDHNQMLKKNS